MSDKVTLKLKQDFEFFEVTLYDLETDETKVWLVSARLLEHDLSEILRAFETYLADSDEDEGWVINGIKSIGETGFHIS
mgnify:CR=1 FL=1